jgi:hypothetical protein
MRWIFGNQKNEDINTNNLPSSIPSTSASTPARRQNNNLNNKKRRSFAAFLRESIKSTSKSVDCATVERKNIKSGGLLKNNSLLTSSRTFDAQRFKKNFYCKKGI